MAIENAVDAMNDAIDGVVDLYRAQEGRSPTRHEIYLVYRHALEGRMFADDEFFQFKVPA
jgi:hypothetical protein